MDDDLTLQLIDFVTIDRLEPGPESGWPFKQKSLMVERAWYSYEEAWMWLVATESWEWGQLKLDLDCEPPPYNHWLSGEMDAVGDLDDILGVSEVEGVEQFLLENGIAPGQPFFVQTAFWCHQDYWGEWDSGVEMEVVDIAKWDPERVAIAWEAFFMRKRVLVP